MAGDVVSSRARRHRTQEGLDALEVEAAKAKATQDLALALSRIGGALEDLKPAADAIHGLGEAQRKLCLFLVGNRLKLTASIPVVLILIQGVSPNAAKIIGQLLHAWGVT